jgi:hypothetical protein
LHAKFSIVDLKRNSVHLRQEMEAFLHSDIPSDNDHDRQQGVEEDEEEDERTRLVPWPNTS